MKLFDLVFELVRQNVPMPREDWAQMKKEMEQDTAKWTHDHENKLIAMYAKYNDQWWFRLAVACSFIPLNRAIQRYTNPIEQDDDQDVLQ